MRIAIFGGSGFIGQRLAQELVRRKDEVVVVSRAGRPDADGVRYITWQALEARPDMLDGFDAFVNLAGETINQRWSKAAKARIVQSRLIATERVGTLVERLASKPGVVINGSGMSIYGFSDDETFDEQSPARLTDFLAETVSAWEQAADRIAGCRVVKLRIGLVLGMTGGAFPLMSLPYRLFVGGKVGDGRQWHSWIHIDDMVSIILYCIAHAEVSGPVNCTAPEPARNEAFGRAVGRSLNRPHWFPVPAFMLKLVLGEMSELLLKGQRVLPRKISEAGYSFQYARLDDALNQLFERRK